MKAYYLRTIAAVCFVGAQAAFAADNRSSSTTNKNKDRSLATAVGFLKFKDKGCRSSYGGKGSETNGDFKLFTDVSRKACKMKCLSKRNNCQGYEYSSSRRWCEVWKSPINKQELEHVHGTHCLIKKSNPPPTPYPTSPYPTTPYPIKPYPTPYETSYHQPAYGNFKFFDGKGCRTGNGKKGSKLTGEFDLFKNALRDTCQSKCLLLRRDCFGYEYHALRGRCEVWKVPIDEFELKDVNGLECYIKDDSIGGAPRPSPYATTSSPTENPSVGPSSSQIPTYNIIIGPTSSPFPTTYTPAPFGFCSPAGKRRCCRAKCFERLVFAERRALTRSERFLVHPRPDECGVAIANAEQFCTCLHCNINSCPKCPARGQWRSLESVDGPGKKWMPK